jgi:hypothetical protein
MGDNGDIAKGSFSHHILPMRTSRRAMLKLKTKWVNALTIESEHFSMVQHTLGVFDDTSKDFSSFFCFLRFFSKDGNQGMGLF